MRLLLLLSESWNDKKYPNNNTTNWFFGMADIEIYTVSGGAEAPNNRCCKNYFQLSDYDMAKALFPFRRAGRILQCNGAEDDTDELPDVSKIENKVYTNRSKLHSWFFRLIRDFIWRYGTYNKALLKQFIDDARPDVIFSQRMGSVKMCRMEQVVRSLTNAPMIAYTGDNEYFLNAMPRSLFGKMHVFWTRRWLDRQIPTYALYYSMSREQMDFYCKKYGVKMDFLVKCGVFEDVRPHTRVNETLQLVYAGKLYAGRWKTLSLLVDAIAENNKREEKKMHLFIYTPDCFVTEQSAPLQRSGVSDVYEAVSPERLKDIYGASDIVLHVESLDPGESEQTRYSFSTKVMDCLGSGCAVMAICRETQAAYAYLKENEVAFTASDKEEVTELLAQIADRPQLVAEYAEKAVQFGKEHHQRDSLQKKLRHDFDLVISETKC